MGEDCPEACLKITLMKLSQEQFDALSAYVKAAVTLAVAKADYNRQETDDDSMGYYHEEIRMNQARYAAEKALVG